MSGSPANMASRPFRDHAHDWIETYQGPAGAASTGAKAQRRADDLKHERDAHAREALEHGLGRRGVAKALCIDKITAQRRYGGRTETH